MNNNTVLIGVGAIILIAVGVWVLTSGGNPQEAKQPQVEEPRVRAFELALASRILTPNIVTVTQGDQVTLKVSTDEAGVYHISGYEILKEMDLTTPIEFTFTADKAGRYNFELHPGATLDEAMKQEAAESGGEEAEHEDSEEDIAIGAFVVNPR